MENTTNYKNSRFGTRKIGWEYAIRGVKVRLRRNDMIIITLCYFWPYVFMCLKMP